MSFALLFGNNILTSFVIILIPIPIGYKIGKHRYKKVPPQLPSRIFDDPISLDKVAKCTRIPNLSSNGEPIPVDCYDQMSLNVVYYNACCRKKYEDVHCRFNFIFLNPICEKTRKKPLLIRPFIDKIYK